MMAKVLEMAHREARALGRLERAARLVAQDARQGLHRSGIRSVQNRIQDLIAAIDNLDAVRAERYKPTRADE